MRTPFDTALRAQRREMDDLRTAIGGAAQSVTDAEHRCRAIGDAMVRESALAAGDRFFSPMPYLARARGERERADEDRRLADAELASLRDRATERYGSLRALEGAADRFREQAIRAIADAEQAAADDLAGARVVRLIGARRRARAHGRSNR